MYRKLFLFILVLALAGTNVAFGQVVWEGRISSGSDDYEQYVSNGDMDSGSSDLEITEEGDPGSNQLIGLRFNGVVVPQGANITSAYVQFHVDETSVPGDNRPGTKFLRGEAVDNAAPFLDVDNNMSSRPTTSAEASWDWPEWLTEHEEGPDQRTSNIAAVIQEIVDRPGWSEGNSLVLIITGSGENTAEAFEGETAAAALLHIEFSTKFASSPTPPDGELYEDTWASLGWVAGETAVTHDVYMSDNFDDVNDGAAAAFQGNQATTSFIVGFPGMPYPDGLVPGTTYYWRIDEVEADGTTIHTGDVWSFMIPPKKAYNPNPADGGKYVDPDVELSWTVGYGAKLHTVYFGDNFDDVNNAVGGLPQPATTNTPGTLELDKTYYWRVDEFDPPTTHKGDVWSFSTKPIIAITDPNLIGWWTFDEGSGSTALDFSGHGNDGELGGNPQWVDGIMEGALDLRGLDYVSIDGVADDLTTNVFTLSIWIKTTMSAGEGVVFGSNTGGSHDFIFGVNDGDLWVEDSSHSTFPPVINDNQWHMITYVRSGNTSTIYADGIQVGTDPADNDPAAETRWSIGQEWDSGPSDLYVGMVDDARFYSKALTPDEVKELMRGDPLVAWNPSPNNNSTVDIDEAKQPLSWSPGDAASEHDVYFGTDKDAVDLADAADTTGIYRGREGTTSYNIPEALEWGGGPYYWRIDENNTDGTISTGGTWSFSVADYIIVDDFEDYDVGNNEIWWVWIDGLGYPVHPTKPPHPGNGTGSMVGDETTLSYMEETIVHGGSQSMPIFYDNNQQAKLRYSEVEKTLSSRRDWTVEGVGVLSLWFYGDASNAAEPLYVALNGNAVVTHDNPNATQIEAWTEWTIDLQLFADQGVNLANVNTIAIGLGNKKNPLAGGSGKIYIDDIRLYRPAP